MSSETRTWIPSADKPSLADLEPRSARYLLAISILSESDTGMVSTGELRKHLNVAPATVTEMFSKLDERDLVEYEKYRGVTLTEPGEAIATQAGWRFCVVSTFFDSVLGTNLDDQTAFDIGFVLPEDGVFELRSLVDSACLGLCPESRGDAQRCVA